MTRRRRPARREAYRRYGAVAPPARRPARAPSSPRRGLRQAESLELDRPRVVSAVILASLILIGLWIGVGDTFYVTKLAVAGQSRVPPEEIAAGSGIAGLHILWVNSSEVEATLLKAMPSIRAAQVACRLPADCTIAVTEREPAWAWRWGQATLWVDAGGGVFPARANAPGLLTGES